MITSSELTASLSQLLTTDYNGSLVKKQALIKILSPIVDALVQCESHCPIGLYESNYVSYLIQTYRDASLGEAFNRDPDEVANELSKFFK